MGKTDNYRSHNNSTKKYRKTGAIMTGVLLGVIGVASVITIANAASDNMKKTPAAPEVQTVAEKIAKETEEISKQAEETSAAVPETEGGDVISKATLMSKQYDYDGAIKLLKDQKTEDAGGDIDAMIDDLEKQKESLVATKPEEVTHVFFHSLIVDPERGFSTGSDEWNRLTEGYCQWFNTVDEFNKIIEQMYDRGYVLVSIYDLLDIEKDADGTEHITTKDIYLPKGKIPVVLSLDDLSYYHAYDGRGIASKIVVGEDGKPVCEYTDSSGKTTTGDYDCVPCLDKFIEEHPDFSYKGAKGTIALTGYNGILGYRTDYLYRDRDDPADDQIPWLEANPDFDWDKECADAKKAAQAIKDDGWTFASHTWGHIRIGDSDMDRIKTDTARWKETVEPLIGDTDIIIFAHGQDLVKWDEEYEGTEKYEYLKSQGFSIYCNVDSSKYYMKTGDGYFRMGRRNIDGLRVWQGVYGDTNYIDDLFDAASVIDPKRPADASMYE